jgi:hypothetical protein
MTTMTTTVLGPTAHMRATRAYRFTVHLLSKLLLLLHLFLLLMLFCCCCLRLNPQPAYVSSLALNCFGAHARTQ